MDHDELVRLERSGWEALSTDGGAAPFYDRVLDDTVRFLLPGGMVIDDRRAVIESMSGAPWSSFALSDERVVALGGDAAVVTYRCTAERAGSTYEALIASTYRRTPEGWRLVLHQQTPI